MTILHKIARRDFKLNRKRSIGTIVGITLSVALIMAVATMLTSLRQTLIQREIDMSGYYHIKLSQVTPQQLKKIRQNRDFKQIKTTSDLGVAAFDHADAAVEQSPLLTLQSLNATKPTALGYHLSSGTWPQTDQEIVISESAMLASGLKIGDQLQLKIGKPTVKKRKLPDSDALIEQATVVKGKNQNFRITGVLNADNYGYQGLTSAAKAKSYTVYLALKDPQHFRRDLPELLGLSNYHQVREGKKARYRYSLNDGLLHWEVLQFSDKTMLMLVTVATIVIAVIMLTSIFCIRNSFAISITEKTKTYGMLASVGATKKQIKRIVLLQSGQLGLIGIPLGLGLGVLASYILGLVVNHIGSQFLFGRANSFQLKFSWIGLLIAVVLGWATIYFSASSSARRASKVSPIAQIRNEQDVKLTSKNLRVPKWIQRVFKSGGVLAYKNLRRSRKKYRTTVISLAVSVFTFIAMSAFVTAAFNFSYQRFHSLDFNLSFSPNYAGMALKSAKTQAQIQAITKLPDTKHVQVMTALADNGNLKLAGVENHLAPGLTARDHRELQLLALDRTAFRKYGRANGLTEQQLASGLILFDNDTQTVNGKQINVHNYRYQAGDLISGSYQDNSSSPHKKYQAKFRLSGVTRKLPDMVSFYWTMPSILIADQQVAQQQLPLVLQSIVMDASKPEDTIREVRKITLQLGSWNLDGQIREEKTMRLLISIFLYGFIIVITLIGITNIFNTITANMALRQREFAVLKSVGMTKKEFDHMVNLETLFYSLKSLVIGVVSGIGVALLIYWGFNRGQAEQVHYQLPWLAIGLAIVFVFLLVFWIMRYSLRKFNRQNIIETIRKENV